MLLSPLHSGGAGGFSDRWLLSEREGGGELAVGPGALNRGNALPLEFCA